MIFGFVLHLIFVVSAQQTVAKPVFTAPAPAPSQAPATQQVPSVSATTIQTVNQTSDAKPARDSAGEGMSQTPGAPGVAATGATPPDPAASSATYIIGPQDNLQINVWKEAGISGTFPVRPDGMISLSLIGEVAAAGKTPRKLGDEIATRLKKYITDPSVNVIVLGVYPKQIYLLGEVAHIGALAITPEMTPLQAIAAAGGVTPFAKTKSIYILRGEQGKQQKIPFNYKKAIQNGNQQGVTLVPGDTIVVP